MPFIFQPCIYNASKNGGQVFFLPRPIDSLAIHDTWDMDRKKVPLRDGEQVTGHSLNALSISLSGRLDIDGDGTPVISEEDMYLMYETMRSILDVSRDTDKFEFYYWYDFENGVYRKYKSVSAVDFKTDLGDQNHTEFPYSIEMVASDPVIYTTEPGL